MSGGTASTIGLTGGIGSGKSTVARRLVTLGAVLVDTDAIARSLTAAGGAAMTPIRTRFGAAIVRADGALDRDRMRRIAFADGNAKAALEAILHPLIGLQAREQAAAAGDRPVVVDVPLLAESGHWRQRVARVLVVDCLEETQVERVAKRAGWNADTARSVIAQQAPRSARRAIADAVIYNDGIDCVQLEAEVDALWALWSGPLRAG